MERQRNWLGWAALALAGVALLVALGGRFSERRMMAYAYKQEMMARQALPQAPQAPQAPEAPRFERGFDGQGMPFHGRGDQSFGRGDEGFGPGFHGRGPEGFAMGRGDRGGFGFGPLGMLFGLFSALTKLAALGMLVWLLVRLFQQRRAAPAAAAPTTPAGHDPRVE